MSALRELAAELERLKRADLARNKPQLHRSSIENGAIQEFDAEGNLTGVIGKQFDGSHGAVAFNGPTPPTPAAAFLLPGRNTITARWNGTFLGADGQPSILVLAPLTFTRVTVHAGQDPAFDPLDPATQFGSIESARGGEVIVGPLEEGTWHIKLLAWTSAGKPSAPSPAATGTPLREGSIVLDEIDAAVTRIENAREILLDGQEQLGGKLDQLGDDQEALAGTVTTLRDTTLPALESNLSDAQGRLSTAEGELEAAFGRLDTAEAGLEAIPGSIETAKQAAITAAAADAQGKADTARQAAIDAAATHAALVASGAKQEAIDAAAADAQSKANTAKQAAIDAAALDATSKANTAKSEAISAAAGDATTKMNNVANSKNAVFYSLNPATSSTPGTRVFDTWRQRDLSGNIIAEWEWSGSQWNKRALTDAMLTGLDVGKLTAGSATVSDLVAQKIAASTAAIQKADIGNLTVTGTSNLANLVAQRIAANTGQFISLAVSQLTAGTAAMDNAVINKLFSDVVVARMATAESFIGGNAILDESVTAPKIVASEEMWAKVLGAHRVEAEEIAAGAIQAEHLDVVAGDPAGTRMELKPDGLKFYGPDGSEAVNLSSTPPQYLGILDSDGNTLAAMSDDGTVSGHALNIENDPVLAGDNLLGTLQSWESPAMYERTGWLDDLSRGIVATGRRLITRRRVTNGEFAQMELHFDYFAGRSYLIHIEPLPVYLDTNSFGYIRVRREYTDITSARPTLDSVLQRQFTIRNLSGGRNLYNLGGSYLLDASQSATCKLLISIGAEPGGIEVWASNDHAWLNVQVYDQGMRVERTGINREDSKYYPTGVTTAPPAPPQVKNYTKTYTANGYRSFYTSGGHYNWNTGKMFQGNSPGVGGLQSMATFPSMTGDLSGATITSIRAYFYFEHWYYNSGGTAQIGLHGATSLPSTKPSITHAVTSSGWPKPGGRWVNIPSQYWAGFRSGAYRGVTLGDTSPSLTEYGYARGSATKIEVKYTK